RTIRMVFALPAHEHGAAFVHRARSQHVACECSARAAREFFSIPQIAGEQFQFFEVLMHMLLRLFWLFPLVPIYFSPNRSRLRSWLDACRSLRTARCKQRVNWSAKSKPLPHSGAQT